MEKKLFISLSLVALMGITTAQAMAHSTIYTDELGRLHFLGKDPGAKTLQKVEDYDNPYVKDVTNTTSAGKANLVDYYENERKVNAKTKAKGQERKAKGSFSSNKGAMDASNPYVYGGTFIKKADEKVDEDLSKKRFWHLW